MDCRTPNLSRAIEDALVHFGHKCSKAVSVSESAQSGTARSPRRPVLASPQSPDLTESPLPALERTTRSAAYLCKHAFLHPIRQGLRLLLRPHYDIRGCGFIGPRSAPCSRPRCFCESARFGPSGNAAVDCVVACCRCWPSSLLLGEWNQESYADEIRPSAVRAQRYPSIPQIEIAPWKGASERWERGPDSLSLGGASVQSDGGLQWCLRFAFAADQLSRSMGPEVRGQRNPPPES